jgi:hypothetical protein
LYFVQERFGMGECALVGIWRYQQGLRESIGDSLDGAGALERMRVAGAAYSLFSTRILN